jgi:NAD(P)-dependent dehydrogenase (short-subunit alcohol dehydrogenase family)
VTDYTKVEEILRSTVANGKYISGFVHCAGIEKTVLLKGTKPSVFKEIFETNVFAAFELARIISQKGIVDPTGASFLFLSSVLGRLGNPGSIAYSSSKSALLSGVKSMALELAQKKIRCNCLLPGIVETEMIQKLYESIPPEAKEKITSKYPLGLGKPSDIAALAAFLLSDNARWITGAEYVIDGGYSAQ